MFRIIAKSLKTGSPDGGAIRSARARRSGFPVIDFSRCTACDDCARACPTGAIQSPTPAPGRQDADVVVRRVHPVPGVRRGVSGTGGRA